MNPMDMPSEELAYSHQAECAVLGAVLMSGPDAFDAAGLKAEDFFQPLHQTLWTEASKLILAGKHVDVVGLIEAMRGVEVDWSYVQGLTDGFVSLRAVRAHAKIIRDHAKARALSAAARTVAGVAADESISVEQRVAQSVSTLEAVVDEKAEKDALPIADFVADFLDNLQDMADGKVTPARATRIPGLDRLLNGGLRDGQLVIIAARPSQGKSSFAQQLALSHAQDGFASAFFGMEMDSKELTNRTVANVGRVPLKGLKSGLLDSDQWGRVPEAIEGLRGLPLFLYDQPGMTLAEVASKARKLVRKHGMKTLVVDYLQLMKGSGLRNERRVELEEITRGSKQLAKQLGITVVLLSQLNREVEKRTNPRPQMADLKECGAIEEDADVIMALWTHKQGEGDSGEVKGCAVLKNRDGERGEVALHFAGQYQRWTESTESLHAPAIKKPMGGGRFSEEFN